jgi:hypothetical protein
MLRAEAEIPGIPATKIAQEITTNYKKQKRIIAESNATYTPCCQ